MVFVRSAADDAPIVAEAAWEGRIGFDRRGAGGFGYDPLFIVAGGDVTVRRRCPRRRKTAVSHRGQALVGAGGRRWQVAGW